MRSYRPVKASVREVVEYYTQDESLKKSGYYASAESASELDQITSAVWMGAEAAEQGLSGFVEQAALEQLMEEGVLPTTGERIRGSKRNGKEQLAFDTVLSAPKSFSMHAVKDIRLFHAHMRAVAKTLEQIERFYSIAREGPERQQVIAGKVIAAAIPHWTSRELDMNLHTHLLIMNGVKCPSGKWRAIFDRPLSRANWLGSFYRHELAKEAQMLGYSIHETPLHGGYSFDIDGPMPDEIKQFSKRSAQISKEVEVWKEKGFDVDRDDVVLTTRKAKNVSESWEELRDRWVEEMHDIALQEPAEGPQQPLSIGTAADILDSAIRHYSERSVLFSKINLYQYAFEHLSDFSIEDFDLAIAGHTHLLSLGEDNYTTAECLEREVEIIQTWKAHCKEPVTPLASEVDLAATQLNSGQKIAIARTLKSTSRHQIIHGLSGAGKTTAQRQIVASAGIPIFGYAPTIKAAQALEKELKVKTNTVESLILNGAPTGLWIIDEAGLKSTRQMQEVLKLAEQSNSRILLVGDTGQNSAVEAGSPMHSLMRHGAETHRISEIIRQKNKDQKRAVELLAAGKGVEAIAVLEQQGYITEEGDDGERADKIAEAYLEQREQYNKPDDLIVVTGTNAEKERVTDRIREALKEQGVLGQSVDAVQLVDRSWTQEQASIARNYQKGDYLKLGYASKASALSQGTFYQVEAVKDDLLTITSPGGRCYRVNPAKLSKPKVFYARSIDYAVGDRVVFKDTDRKKGYTNGKELVISKVQGTTLTGVDKFGKKQQIEVNVPLPLDHGWVGTSYKWQGTTAKEAIVSLTSDPTSSRNPVYVATSRQTHHLKIFTQDRHRLREWAGVDNRQKNLLEELDNGFRNSTSRTISPSRFRRPANQRDVASKPTATASLANIGRAAEAFNSKDTRHFATAIREASHRTTGLDTGRVNERLRGAFEQGGTPEKRYWQALERSVSKGRTRDSRSTPEPGTHLRKWRQSVREFRRHETDSSLATRFIRAKIVRELAGPLAELTAALEGLATAKQSLAQAQVEIAERVSEARVDVLGQALQQWRLMPEGTKANTVVQVALEQLELAVPEIKPFWAPNYEGVDRPANICEKHWQEMQESCIHPDLITANISTIEGDGVYDRLIGERLSGMGAGQHVTMPQKRKMLEYRLPAKGGWWGTAGVNPHTFDQSLWGCFKPDHPRIDVKKSKAKGKQEYRKYEHPLGTPRELYLAHVPDHLAQKILARHGVTPLAGENFWATVIRENLPIVVIEGLKKTLASLSQGHITVGVSGVNALYRSKDENKKLLPMRELNPDFLPFCTPGRAMSFAYDEDTKLSSILNVQRDMVRSLELIEPLGPDLTVARWKSEDGKGADDLIAQSGPLAFEQAIEEALPIDSTVKSHYRKEYNRHSKKVRKWYRGLSPEQVDVAVYIEAVNRGDNLDGDRVLKQSDHARETSESGEDYPEHIKGLAFEQYQLNIQAAKLGRELVRRYGRNERWTVDSFQFVQNKAHFKILKDNKPILNYDTRFDRVSGVVNQSQVEAMQSAITKHRELQNRLEKPKGKAPSIDLEIG